MLASIQDVWKVEHQDPADFAIELPQQGQGPNYLVLASSVMVAFVALCSFLLLLHCPWCAAGHLWCG